MKQRPPAGTGQSGNERRHVEFRNSIQAHFDTHLLSSSTLEFKDIGARGMATSLKAAKSVG